MLAAARQRAGQGQVPGLGAVDISHVGLHGDVAKAGVAEKFGDDVGLSAIAEINLAEDRLVHVGQAGAHRVAGIGAPARLQGFDIFAEFIQP